MHFICCYFEPQGMYCKQCFSVVDAKYESNKKFFPGFTVNDIGVQYCSAYMHLAYKISAPRHSDDIALVGLKEYHRSVSQICDTQQHINSQQG